MDGAIILPTEATTVMPGLNREETHFSQTGCDEGPFSCAYPHVSTFVLFRVYVWECTVSFIRNDIWWLNLYDTGNNCLVRILSGLVWPDLG